MRIRNQKEIQVYLSEDEEYNFCRHCFSIIEIGLEKVEELDCGEFYFLCPICGKQLDISDNN